MSREIKYELEDGDGICLTPCPYGRRSMPGNKYETMAGSYACVRECGCCTKHDEENNIVVCNHPEN